MKTIFFLLFFVATQLSAQDISTADANHIFLLGNLEQFENQIPSSMESMVERQKDKVGNDEYLALQYALKTAFVQDSVHGSFLLKITENFDNKLYAECIRWFSSPLAMKMAKMETAGENAEFIDDEEIPEKRKELIDRLIKVTKAGEMFGNLIFPPALAMAKLQNSEDMKANEADLAKITKPLAKMMQSLMESLMPGQLAGMYHDATDEELETYVKYYESELGSQIIKKINTATVETMKERTEAFIKVYKLKIPDSSSDIKKM